MRMLLILLALGLISSEAQAEIITFKDGRTITGTIVEQDDKELKLDLKGMTMTYYIEEIQDIDGKALTPAAPAVPVVEQEQAANESLAPELVETKPSVEDPEEKKALVLRFIEVFGTRQAMESNFATIIDSLAQQKPEEARNIRDKFKIDEVIDRLVPVYQKYFTTQDLKAYIDFYSSVQGRKLISGIGSITKDSVDVGSAYLKEKFPEITDQQ